MKALIDGDMLRYEVGFGVQFKDDEGNPDINNFEAAERLLISKIDEILENTWADDYIIYLTGDKHIYEWETKTLKYDPNRPFLKNFREDIAVTKPYKGDRSSLEKPYHFVNLTNYIMATQPTKVVWGLEADDLLCVDALNTEEDVIICSRDKDLRMVPVKHYGWPCGKAPQFGPKDVDYIGEINLVKNNKELKGWGIKFFYSQMIIGDKVDSIPGLPRGGPVLAYKTLSDLTTRASMEEAVVALYKDKMGDKWKEYFYEQATLLWMIRELNEDGTPVMFKMLEDE